MLTSRDRPDRCRPPARRAAQADPPARSGDAGTPSAAATAAFTTSPCIVFTPDASAGSARTASATPLVASSTAYGSVAFVSAYVDVFGTAPGTLPTA